MRKTLRKKLDSHYFFRFITFKANCQQSHKTEWSHCVHCKYILNEPEWKRQPWCQVEKEASSSFPPGFSGLPHEKRQTFVTYALIPQMLPFLLAFPILRIRSVSALKKYLLPLYVDKRGKQTEVLFHCFCSKGC